MVAEIAIGPSPRQKQTTERLGQATRTTLVGLLLPTDQIQGPLRMEWPGDKPSPSFTQTLHPQVYQYTFNYSIKTATQKPTSNRPFQLKLSARTVSHRYMITPAQGTNMRVKVSRCRQTRPCKRVGMFGSDRTEGGKGDGVVSRGYRYPDAEPTNPKHRPRQNRLPACLLRRSVCTTLPVRQIHQIAASREPTR